MSCPLKTMNNGLKIPSIGFGVYKISDGNVCKDCCLKAIKIGYRLIDTAHKYGNEKYVSMAVKECGLKREEIFITSKIWCNEFGQGVTKKAIDAMLKRMKLDYIDLVLLHWPFGDYIGAWKDLEECVRENKLKSIGLSNFEGKSLEDILNICTIKPVVDQMECHPFKNKLELKEILDKHGIIMESWYPIGHGDQELLSYPLLDKLVEKYKKTKSQIILKWHIQNGYIPLPKSTNYDHIKENFELFDFNLSDEEMEEINKFPQKPIWKPHLGSMKGQEEYCLTEKCPKDDDEEE